MNAKRKLFVATVAVWLTAGGLAAAVTYELKRPLREPRELRELPTPALQKETSPPVSARVPDNTPEPPILYIDTVTIEGRIKPRVAPARTLAAPRRDISAMRCDKWR